MIQIQFERDRQRAAAYDGDTLVGFCEIQTTDNAWTIVHTEVDPAYGGQGIARKLVQAICEQAEKENAEIVPVCTYAKRVLR